MTIIQRYNFGYIWLDFGCSQFLAMACVEQQPNKPKGKKK